MTLSPIRIGAVSYLNAQPLIDGLDDADLQLRENFVLELAPPAIMADMLTRDEIDVALIPVAAFLRGDYEILPVGCIGCMGPVESVRIFSQKPIREVESLQLDPASRSSNGLARVLAQHLWNISPRWIDGDDEGTTSDARVIIGDEALRLIGTAPYEYDLGEAWMELTQLPFVFAVWAVRPGLDLGNIPKLLEEALQRGVANFEKIAQRASERLGLPLQQMLDYLQRDVQYGMGDNQFVAIEMYYRMMHDMGLVPDFERIRHYRASPRKAG